MTVCKYPGCPFDAQCNKSVSKFYYPVIYNLYSNKVYPNKKGTRFIRSPCTREGATLIITYYGYHGLPRWEFYLP